MCLCSIRSSPHTSLSRRNARSCSWFRCQSEVSWEYVAVMTCVHKHSAEVLAVPKNMKLLAIPLFELYDNAARLVSRMSAPVRV